MNSPWQIGQMVDAVRLLCGGVLRLAWAAAFPWGEWKQAHLLRLEVAGSQALHAAPPRLPAASGSTAFVDAFDPQEASRRYPESFARLRTEIRARHYSIRTEGAYAMWVARFLAFRKYQAPEALGASDVRCYLEYLATVREISASTQNQALCALVFFYGKVL